MRAGFSQVDILLAGSVFAMLATFLVGAYLYGEETTKLSGNRAIATMLAEEGVEVARNIRDASFSNLVDGSHGLATSSNQWVFSGENDTVSIFTRTVAISTINTNRKGVKATITWQENLGRMGTVEVETELSYWQKVIEEEE